jgi:hypothetical protein
MSTLFEYFFSLLDFFNQCSVHLSPQNKELKVQVSDTTGDAKSTTAHNIKIFTQKSI